MDKKNKDSVNLSAEASTTLSTEALMTGQEKMETDEQVIERDDMQNDGPSDYLNESSDDDEFGFNSSEATFSFTVDNIHKLSDSVTSPATYIRGLPWKILIMPRTDRNSSSKCLGYFLQCNADNDSTCWSCHGSAELRILPNKENVEILRKKIDHVFYCKENDWGFSNFLSWNELLAPEKGYISSDKKVTFQVHVFADAPHGLQWDSRKLTGYIGLKNQGATCYMNSLLQTLFFTNKLRKAVYMMPTESDDSLKSVSLALQRVFYELQFSDKPVGTKKLTKSFGWETFDSFMQHDVQELSRVLLDNVELKMKGTCVEGTIPNLLEGKFKSYVKCKNVDYISSREESFFDIQLQVKGNKNILNSFQTYVKPDTLDGDNKFDAGDFGMQEAEKGIIFKSFPPVLHLQLLRFQYDPVTDMYVKTNDKYEFSDILCLDEFLEDPDENDPAIYILHAILVHSGDNHGGHYVAYLNPKGDGKWFKFDDDVVSRCTKKEAFLCSYGGISDDSFLVRNSTNAYMLVYVRKSKLEEVLCPVYSNDIPNQLVERLNEERNLEAYRRKERQDAYLYMTVYIITEDMFCGHQSYDLLDIERQNMMRIFKVLKQDPYSNLLKLISMGFGYSLSSFRLWTYSQRPNGIWRPALLDVGNVNEKSVFEAAENENPWHVWIQFAPVDCISQTLLPFDKQGDILIFLKMFDPFSQTLSYCGHIIIPIDGTSVESLAKELCKIAGFSPKTPLQIFEEISGNDIRMLPEKDRTLGEVLDKLMDGNIIIFQPQAPSCPDAIQFFIELRNLIDVLVCDKNDPLDPGFIVTLNMNWSYIQVAETIADKLDADPMMLQFFRVQTPRDIVGSVVRSSFEGKLKDILMIYGSRKQSKKLFYQHLTMKVDEFENKRQFRCIFVSPSLKEEEIVLYPNKTGCVASLLEECRKNLQIDNNVDLRLLEVTGNRICSIFSEEKALEEIVSYVQSPRMYRIEIIPVEQKEVDDDEALICVAHFQNDVYSTFGTPILIKIKTGERFQDIKSRIQKSLDISDDIFDTYKTAVIMGSQVKYMQDGIDVIINLKDILPQSTINNPFSPKLCVKAWIGLDHVNKTCKRQYGRFGHTEKAIKIHN